MINISEFISRFPPEFTLEWDQKPWELMKDLDMVIEHLIQKLSGEFEIKDGVAIHRTAIIERWVTLKAPLIVCANCKIGSNSYFREGVFLDEEVKIGPGSEIKSSVICRQSAIAHMNYVGNSLIGRNVNFEAGSIAANHYNERQAKEISVIYN